MRRGFPLFFEGCGSESGRQDLFENAEARLPRAIAECEAVYGEVPYAPSTLSQGPCLGSKFTLPIYAGLCNYLWWPGKIIGEIPVYSYRTGEGS